MATVYYTQVGATAKNDEPANPSLPAPWVAGTQTAYQTELASIIQADPERYGLTLLVSRSATRVNAVPLNGEVLDAGKLYAIYLPDFPELGFSQVEFYLDAVLVHTELSDPWDYDGTTGGGDNIRVSFVAGSHTIDAIVTYPGGTINVSADLEVE